MSLATPAVAGVGALALSANALSVADLEEILQKYSYTTN